MLLKINKQDKRIQHLFQVFLLKNALRTLESPACHVSEREETWYPAAKIAITVRLPWLCAFLFFYLEGAERPVADAIRPISIY